MRMCVRGREKEESEEEERDLKTTYTSLLQLWLPDNLEQESEQQLKTSY